jgi:hypothetical protein
MRANIFFFLSTTPLVPLVFKSPFSLTICATQGMHPPPQPPQLPQLSEEGVFNSDWV